MMPCFLIRHTRSHHLIKTLCTNRLKLCWQLLISGKKADFGGLSSLALASSAPNNLEQDLKDDQWSEWFKIVTFKKPAKSGEEKEEERAVDEVGDEERGMSSRKRDGWQLRQHTQTALHSTGWSGIDGIPFLDPNALLLLLPPYARLSMWMAVRYDSLVGDISPPVPQLTILKKKKFNWQKSISFLAARDGTISNDNFLFSSKK